MEVRLSVGASAFPRIAKGRLPLGGIILLGARDLVSEDAALILHVVPLGDCIKTI